MKNVGLDRGFKIIVQKNSLVYNFNIFWIVRSLIYSKNTVETSNKFNIDFNAWQVKHTPIKIYVYLSPLQINLELCSSSSSTVSCKSL